MSSSTVPASLPAITGAVRELVAGGVRGRHAHLAANLPEPASVPPGPLREQVERIAALHGRYARAVGRMRELVGGRRDVYAADRAAFDAALVDGQEPPAPKLPEHDRQAELEASQAAALIRAIDAAVDCLLGEVIPEHGEEAAQAVERRAAKLVAKAQEAQATADAAAAEADRALALAGFLRRGSFGVAVDDPTVTIGVGRLESSV